MDETVVMRCAECDLGGECECEVCENCNSTCDTVCEQCNWPFTRSTCGWCGPVRHALCLAGVKGWPFRIDEGVLYYARGGELFEDPHTTLDFSPYEMAEGSTYDYQSWTR